MKIKRNQDNFKTTSFILGDNNNGVLNMRHKFHDKYVSYMAKKIINDYKRLSKIFNIFPKVIFVSLVYSREEMNAHWKSKTPSWLVGFSKKEQVFIFSPLFFRGNKLNKNKINKIITHEIVHLFIHTLNKNPLMWIDEGYASFFAKQKKKKIKNKDVAFLLDKNFLTNNISIADFSNHGGYDISNMLVGKIVKKYGEKMIFKIIKSKSFKKDIEFKKMLN